VRVRLAWTRGKLGARLQSADRPEPASEPPVEIHGVSDVRER
jgi:hypothetical protein